MYGTARAVDGAIARHLEGMLLARLQDEYADRIAARAVIGVDETGHRTRAHQNLVAGEDTGEESGRFLRDDHLDRTAVARDVDRDIGTRGRAEAVEVGIVLRRADNFGGAVAALVDLEGRGERLSRLATLISIVLQRPPRYRVLTCGCCRGDARFPLLNPFKICRGLLELFTLCVSLGA